MSETSTVKMTSKPIPLLLKCPECGTRHIDEGHFATHPHHTHSCQKCGHTWRPAIECTVGVQFLPGFKNEPHPDAYKILEELVSLEMLLIHVHEGQISIGQSPSMHDRMKGETAKCEITKVLRTFLPRVKEYLLKTARQ